MPVSINYFKSFVEALANKNQSGNSVTVAQFNTLANQAQLSQFEFDRNVYINTGEITKYLTFFMKNVVKQVPPATGFLPYPNDWEHTIALRSYFIRPDSKSIEVEIAEAKDKSWGEIQASSLLSSNKRFPKFMEFSNEYRFLPKDIGTVYLDYLKTPTAPEWKYTTVNNRPVYDPVNSVDFDWEDFSLNQIACNYLKLIGINLQMPELNAFATQFKAESSAPL